MGTGGLYVQARLALLLQPSSQREADEQEDHAGEGVLEADHLVVERADARHLMMTGHPGRCCMVGGTGRDVGLIVYRYASIDQLSPLFFTTSVHKPSIVGTGWPFWSVTPCRSLWPGPLSGGT